MFAKSAIVSLALVAVASPVLSAPLPVAEALGKGILSGGAISGLSSLLGGEGDDSSATPASRDLETRGGLASILEKLVDAGEESLESVLKNTIAGGIANGAAVEGVNAAAGQSSKRGIPAAVVDDAAKVARKTIGSVIGDGVASSIGHAVGDLGIGAIISKLFGLHSSDDSSSRSSSSKRALADLSDEEVNTLLEYINEMNGGSNAIASRAIALGSVDKGIAGLVAGLAATQGTESAIRREASFDDLD
ncbi:hypothetical protein FB451DRAFT_1174777 [Mycena latifolia]|nr:hypothetical protein FB451DRAFT_1174777 [Mycena latifolia]